MGLIPATLFGLFVCLLNIFKN